MRLYQRVTGYVALKSYKMERFIRIKNNFNNQKRHMSEYGAMTARKYNAMPSHGEKSEEYVYRYIRGYLRTSNASIK